MSASSRPQRVLVLGGTGLLGAAIGLRFAQLGSQVVVLARRPPEVGSLLSLVASHVVCGDASDETALANGLIGVDHVVHAVGVRPPALAELDPKTVVAESLAAISVVLRHLSVRPAVSLTYLSSGGAVYGEADQLPAQEDSVCRPKSAYGIAKRACELAILEHGERNNSQVSIARVSNAYGHGQRVRGGQGLIAALLSGVRTSREVPVFGNGDIVRDYVHIDDAADAVVGLSSRRRSDSTPLVVNVGSGIGHSITEAADVVQAVTGVRPTLRPSPIRPFDVTHNVLDTRKLASLIKWAPMPLAVGVSRTWADLLSAEADGMALA